MKPTWSFSTDDRSVAPTPATLGHSSENPLYRVFLYAPAASTDLAAWFAAGANDALRVPISRGELLARLRVGARWLEFENRMRSRSSRSRSSGMFSARGLWRKLSRLADLGSISGHTLLSVTIDFFAGLRREEGESAARHLQTALATAIQQSVTGDAIAACGDDGTLPHPVARLQSHCGPRDCRAYRREVSGRSSRSRTSRSALRDHGDRAVASRRPSRTALGAGARDPGDRRRNRAVTAPSNSTLMRKSNRAGRTN